MPLIADADVLLLLVNVKKLSLHHVNAAKLVIVRKSNATVTMIADVNRKILAILAKRKVSSASSIGNSGTAKILADANRHRILKKELYQYDTALFFN